MNWLIIADDLSGAADCAVGFAASGSSAIVTLHSNADSSAVAEVIAVDVDSRRQTREVATARTIEAWHRNDGAQRQLYKKIDSTLRGNWASEIAGLQRVAGMAIVAPAFPATGRTTLGGRMFLHGVPLESSDIWRMEGMSGQGDVVASLMAEGLVVELIPTNELAANADAMRSRLLCLAAQGVQAVACDAQTTRDLEIVVEATLDLDVKSFWAGSGGLARALSASETPRKKTKPAELCGQPLRGPVLTVVGSLSSVSARQADFLHERSSARRIVVPSEVLRQGPHHAHWAGLQNNLAYDLIAGADVLMSVDRDEHFDPIEGPQLSAALASLVAPHFHRTGGLIATGGETARAILESSGINCLEVIEEIEPGVPLSRTRGPLMKYVVTKAGAFGSEATLWNAWNALKETCM